MAGGVTAGMNPQSLPARVALGALVGGGVSGGTQVAFNVMGGRPWNQDLGQAVTVGMATGAVDAFTDYYGDKVIDRVMTPQPRPAGADGDTDGLRRWGAADAERGAPRRPGDADDAFGTKTNAQIRDEAIELLREKVGRLDPESDLAEQGRDLLNQIDAEEVRARIVDEGNYLVTHKDWFGQPGDPTDRGTVNLDTGDILLNRGQFGSVEEVMLTVFHEGVHYQDYDNVVTLAREMHAFGRTAKFAEAVGLKYGALGKEDLTAFIRAEGTEGLERLITKVYDLEGHKHQPNPFAVRRHGDMDTAYGEYFAKDFLPKLSRIEETMGVSLRNDPTMLRFQLEGHPEMLWQYARHISGQKTPYDPARFNERLRSTIAMQEFLNTLPERFLELP